MNADSTLDPTGQLTVTNWVPVNPASVTVVATVTV